MLWPSVAKTMRTVGTDAGSTAPHASRDIGPTITAMAPTVASS